MKPSRVAEMRELQVVLKHAAGRLSPARVAALVAHPDAVPVVLAAAADTLSMGGLECGAPIETIGSGVPPLVDAEQSTRRMDARARDGTPETLLTSDELAAQAGLKTRQSVHDWRRKGRIVGWQNAKRGYLYPAAQLDGRNRPLPGLDRVVGQFGDAYAAWVWLTTPRPSLDRATPLSLLARGEVERVEEAARGDLQGDFA